MSPMLKGQYIYIWENKINREQPFENVVFNKGVNIFTEEIEKPANSNNFVPTTLRLIQYKDF